MRRLHTPEAAAKFCPLHDRLLDKTNSRHSADFNDNLNVDLTWLPIVPFNLTDDPSCLQEGPINAMLFLRNDSAPLLGKYKRYVLTT